MDTGTTITIGVTVVCALFVGRTYWQLRKQLARHAAEQAWRDRPDPAAVAAQRQLWDDGEFNRAITNWAPHDKDFDMGTLSCGHWILRSRGNHEETHVGCSSCASDFLAKARLTMGRSK